MRRGSNLLSAKLLIMLILCLVLGSTVQGIAESNSYEQKLRFTGCGGMGEVEAAISWKKNAERGEFEPKKITLSPESGGKPFQTIELTGDNQVDVGASIDPTSPSAPLSGNLTNDFLEALDLNFDGFVDLRVLVSRGTEVSNYIVFLFNPEKKQFERTHLFDEVPSFSPVPELKIIKSYGFNAGEYEIETFLAYNKGALEKVAGQYQYPADVALQDIESTFKELPLTKLLQEKVKEKAQLDDPNRTITIYTDSRGQSEAHVVCAVFESSYDPETQKFTKKVLLSGTQEACAAIEKQFK